MDFANVASQLNAGTILPEGIVVLTFLGVLIVDLILGRNSSRWIGYLAIAGLLASIVALYFEWDNANPLFLPVLLTVTTSVLSFAVLWLCPQR